MHNIIICLSTYYIVLGLIQRGVAAIYTYEDLELRRIFPGEFNQDTIKRSGSLASDNHGRYSELKYYFKYPKSRINSHFEELVCYEEDGKKICKPDHEEKKNPIQNSKHVYTETTSEKRPINYDTVVNKVHDDPNTINFDFIKTKQKSSKEEMKFFDNYPRIFTGNKNDDANNINFEFIQKQQTLKKEIDYLNELDDYFRNNNITENKYKNNNGVDLKNTIYQEYMKQLQTIAKPAKRVNDSSFSNFLNYGNIGTEMPTTSFSNPLLSTPDKAMIKSILKEIMANKKLPTQVHKIEKYIFVPVPNSVDKGNLKKNTGKSRAKLNNPVIADDLYEIHEDHSEVDKLNKNQKKIIKFKHSNRKHNLNVGILDEYDSKHSENILGEANNSENLQKLEDKQSNEEENPNNERVIEKKGQVSEGVSDSHQHMEDILSTNLATDENEDSEED